MKNVILLIVGFVLGALLVPFIGTKDNTTLYWTLQENCEVENVGFLKKGTLLRVDEAMSEGFTRCILYLNIKNIQVSDSKEKYEFIPYWLSSKKDNIFDSLNNE